MEGADEPSRLPRTLFTFNTKEDLTQFRIGCDADNGGHSSVHFELDDTPKTNAGIMKPATGKFWGRMRTDVRPGAKITKGGYAAFKSKVRKSFVSSADPCPYGLLG
jgi:NADH dehydrogenase [ubiquinone] 1 alpha subcomplex assembly factor 1